jgi:hypothetical protein
MGLLYGWFTVAHLVIVWLAALLSFLAILAWMAWLVVDWGNDYYIVTNQRVVWLEKVVGIYDSRQESPLNMVLAVGIEQNPFGRALDFGDVVVRTFVGRIVFKHVNHPYQASHMVEEYWQRTREVAASIEKDAIKNALRKQLGIPIPSKLAVDSVKPAAPAPRPKHQSLLRLPVLSVLGALLLFLYRLYQLAFLPNEAFISFNGGFSIDAWAGATLILLVVALGWLGYRIIDWSNDQFIVNAEQIIDLDRKPFGTETRNAAQLENILGTEYKRIGILGNLFNYGTVYITVGGTKLAFEDVMDPATVQSDIDRRRMARTQKKQQAAVAAERERMAEWLATYHRNADELRREERKRDGKSG